jgi:hypothetical protein
MDMPYIQLNLKSSIIKRKFKRWWSTIPQLEIHVQAWDEHKSVAGLNRLRGSQPSLLDNWIFNGITYLTYTIRRQDWLVCGIFVARKHQFFILLNYSLLFFSHFLICSRNTGFKSVKETGNKQTQCYSNEKYNCLSYI